ncbi:MAG: hypothetical protein H0T47_18775 [Planctomycetaceae bacterium]|nr:hypothetical protein [Planctomycetaceae bacterium]
MSADHPDEKSTRTGQWSARKGQLLVPNHRFQGGGYLRNRRRDEAKSLRPSTDGNWHKKSPHSNQFVPNTEAARPSNMHHDPRFLNEVELNRLTKETLVQIAREEELPYRSKMNKAQLARTLRRHFRQPS